MSNAMVRKCLHCRKRAVSPAILPSYAMETEHDGRPYSFSVPNLEVLQCQNCKAVVLTDAANEKIEDALRAAVGLLSPAEIRRRREALGFKQQQLADLLRISMHTLSRWETGAQIQQRAMDMYLRTFFEVPEARRFLGAAEVKPASPQTDDAFLHDFELDVDSQVPDSQEAPAFEAHGGLGEISSGLLTCDAPKTTNTVGLRLAA
jgi:transcriptional regulator with XRE-family HTH domain